MNRSVTQTDDDVIAVVLMMSRAQWASALDSQASNMLECGAAPEHAEVFASIYEQVYGPI